MAQMQDTTLQDYNADIQKAFEEWTLQTALGIITGVSVNRYCWTKDWVQPEAGAPVQYYCDVFALVSMSLPHYDRTIYQTLNNTSKTINDPRATM